MERKRATITKVSKSSTPIQTTWFPSFQASKPQAKNLTPETLATPFVCSHRWDPLDTHFSRAYYGPLGEMEISLCTDDGKRFVLAELPAVIGRDSDCSFLQGNLAVSRRHCEIGFDKAKNVFFVRDLGSSGGTHVDQQPVGSEKTLPIRPGQQLRLSGAALRLEVRLRRELSAATHAAPGPRSISLTDLSAHGMLVVSSAGTLLATTEPESDAIPLVVLHYAKSNETWRILALDRQTVRLNGETFIERELQPFDQLTLNNQSYLYDQTEQALVPETVQAGPTIELRNVRVTARGTVILDGVDCRIPGGRMSAIIGQSGSGKTTLLKILSGNMLPDSGNIFVNGEEMTWVQYGEWARSHLALVPQADVIHGELTVLECLEYSASLLLGFLPLHGRSETAFKN